MTSEPPPDRAIAPQQQADDVGLDTMLRPQRLSQFTGQDRLKDNLRILIEAARARGESLDHVLFHEMCIRDSPGRGLGRGSCPCDSTPSPNPSQREGDWKERHSHLIETFHKY